MSTNTLTGQETAGTTTEPDCGCTPLLACFQHYLDERGRPAIRRVN